MTDVRTLGQRHASVDRTADEHLFDATFSNHYEREPAWFSWPALLIAAALLCGAIGLGALFQTYREKVMFELPSSTFLVPRKRNPEQVSTVDLSIDTSSSTLGNGAAAEIEAGLDKFVADLQRDPLLRNAVELGVLAFGDTTTTERLVDFGPLGEFRTPRLSVGGMTPLCELLCRSVAEVAERQHTLARRCDRDVRQAWIFNFSDGGATDTHRLREAQAARDFATDEDIALFLVGCGENSDMEFLSQLAQPERSPLLMKDVHDFGRFFDWLKVSLRCKSLSQPGVAFELPDPIRGGQGAPGWAAKG